MVLKQNDSNNQIFPNNRISIHLLFLLYNFLTTFCFKDISSKQKTGNKCSLSSKDDDKNQLVFSNLLQLVMLNPVGIVLFCKYTHHCVPLRPSPRPDSIVTQINGYVNPFAHQCIFSTTLLVPCPFPLHSSTITTPLSIIYKR